MRAGHFILLAAVAACGVLSVSGCGRGFNWRPATEKDGVRSIRLEPPDPSPGEVVSVVIEVVDYGIYPAIYVPKNALYGVTGGSLLGRQAIYGPGSEPAFAAVSGASITAALDGVSWQLPGEAGTYILSVSYHGNAMTHKLKLD